MKKSREQFGLGLADVKQKPSGQYRTLEVGHANYDVKLIAYYAYDTKMPANKRRLRSCTTEVFCLSVCRAN